MFLSLLEQIFGIIHLLSLSLHPSKTMLLNIEYSVAKCGAYGRQKSGSVIRAS